MGVLNPKSCGDRLRTRADGVLDHTTMIVAAYVSHHDVSPPELCALIERVHSALAAITDNCATLPRADVTSAIDVQQSLTPDYIICLEDGKKFKSLKRHLKSSYNLTPEAYREKWNLPVDYPMVAPNYATARSKLAKKMGLGLRRNK